MLAIAASVAALVVALVMVLFADNTALRSFAALVACGAALSTFVKGLRQAVHDRNFAKPA